MHNDKDFIFNEIQQYCRIKSPLKSPSPYKTREKQYNDIYSRSKSVNDNNSQINKQKKKNKNNLLDSQIRNQYFQNLLSLPFDDPRPTQEMIAILMKDPATRKEPEMIFLTQILCQYSFFSKIKQIYGLEVVQSLCIYSHYKKYDVQQKIDFNEKVNIPCYENIQQNKQAKKPEPEEDNQRLTLLILISGSVTLIRNTSDISRFSEQIVFQEGFSLQKLTANDLIVDEDDFKIKQKEFIYTMATSSEFIVIPIKDYHMTLQRNIQRLQKIKQIENLVLQKDEETLKQKYFLQQIPIFRNFSNADLYDFMNNMTLERFSHGQPLFKEGDPIHGVYIIYIGEFQIMKKQEKLNQVIQFEALQAVKDVNIFIPNMDQSLVISIIRQGEIFGFEEIIQDIQSRQFTVESSAVNSHVFCIKKQYFQKKFNNLINQKEYLELVTLTQEKFKHRQQFKDKQEYLGFNLLEEIQNSSLGYQIFNKIKEDIDNNDLSKLQKEQEQTQEIQNNGKIKNYRKRLNQDAFNHLEKSLSPLQKTLPSLGCYSNSQINQQNINNNSFIDDFADVKLTKRDFSRPKVINLIKTTPQKERLQSHSQMLSEGQNTWNVSQLPSGFQSHYQTNRQKKTIDFLRQTRRQTTQPQVEVDEIDLFLQKPQSQHFSNRLLQKQKRSTSRRLRSNLTYQEQSNTPLGKTEGEILPSISPKYFNADDYDKMNIIAKNKDIARIKKQLDPHFSIVRVVELSNLDGVGDPIQTVVQTLPQEEVEQFEFISQLDDLKPIVSKRKQILERITKSIKEQTNQTTLQIQMNDALVIPKYMQVKQQRIQEANSSSSPKKESHNKQPLGDIPNIYERQILTKFLKDKTHHQVNIICQDRENISIYNSKKNSVQMAGITQQLIDYVPERNSRQLNYSQGASSHSQKPKHQNPQLQYFQTKKIDKNLRVVSRGNKTIKYCDNRSPPKQLLIQ